MAHARPNGRPFARPASRPSAAAQRLPCSERRPARTESRSSPTAARLYLFVGDNTPAAANGQGVKAFGGGWFVVSPAGNQVSGKSTAGRSNGF